MRNCFLKKQWMKNKGQSLVELTLLLPFFFFLVFSVYYLSLFLMEAHVTRYAAFMAARSYQVYGDEALPDGTKVYQQVGKDIIQNAMPFIKRGEVRVDVDTHALQDQGIFYNRPQPKAFLTKDNWRRVLDHFNMGNVDRDPATHRNALLANLDTPRFGLLKIGFEHENHIPFSEIFFRQSVVVPYRLEERLNPHVN